MGIKEIISNKVQFFKNIKFIKGKKALISLVIVSALVVFTLIIMAINSVKPDVLDLSGINPKTKGAHFVKVNMDLTKQMAEKWLPNDLFWPTSLLDNIPNFQIGVLEVVRYNTRVLRDNLSRMRTTDKLDKSAEQAFTSLSNDPNKWWFPSAESKWKKGNESLKTFYSNLEQGRSNFYPRADNLVQLLDQYTSLMGGVNTRLINAPRDIAEAISIEEDKNTKDFVDTNIPWYRIDNNFYYAQGAAYALHESFRAIKVDFKDILIDKNSMTLVDKIIEDLQRCDFEPLIVFNGDPDSVFANHSLNLSGIFNDARQKINSLIASLKQG